jgi:hypothetical protein
LMILQFLGCSDVDTEFVVDVKKTARVAGGSECKLSTTTTPINAEHESGPR